MTRIETAMPTGDEADFPHLDGQRDAQLGEVAGQNLGQGGQPRYQIMTVCTGNICRSPMAEFVLRHRLDEAGLTGAVQVVSTGTSTEEIGNPMDRRARQVLLDHGYPIYPHRARKVHADELEQYDLVLAMTVEHASKLKMLARGDESLQSRVQLWRSFDPVALNDGLATDLDVDDPWYGELEDFETTLQQCEAATEGIIEHVRVQLAAAPLKSH